MRARFSVVPYVEVAVIDSARHWDAILAFTFLRWGPYLNFLSTCRPRTRILPFSSVTVAPRSTTALILKRFSLLVRCTSSYFLGAKVAPCVFAHFKYTLWAVLSVA